jgi:hypothetical protein
MFCNFSDNFSFELRILADFPDFFVCNRQEIYRILRLWQIFRPGYVYDFIQFPQSQIGGGMNVQMDQMNAMLRITHEALLPLTSAMQSLVLSSVFMKEPKASGKLRFLCSSYFFLEP